MAEGAGPAAGAEVRPLPDAMLTGASLFRPTRTDERGASGDRDLVIELELYSVRGRVLAADGSGPVEGAAVRLEQGPAAPGEAVTLTPRGKTGPDGSFLLSGARPGTAQLRVEKPGYAESVSPVEVVGDMETGTIFLVREAER